MQTQSRETVSAHTLTSIPKAQRTRISFGNIRMREELFNRFQKVQFSGVALQIIAAIDEYRAQ